ncbi:box C/D snoRNA protein 1 isoform X1 [Pieris brassicae]|uniref:box C/D snoRNA protein 1 isoform X1 n=1 Tax=Pieris brassicae TaxID=7116 RepID=UPI001E65EB27|nr:box C/D snoRNA protein 1 isoform X1 [Pieris brassicae]
MGFGIVSSSSESDIENESTVEDRLGNCEVCGANKAIYTCPRCEVKTCCLDCVRIHKAELECNGIRDRTKFVRVKDFTNTDLLNDYRLLEECARFVYSVKKDEKKRFTRIDKDLPIHLYKLKLAARKRGTVLQFLARNFTRNAINTTKLDFKKNLIYWRIEWIFPSIDGNPLKFIDEKCAENKKISDLLDKYLNPDVLPFEGSRSLGYYRSAGLSGVKVLLKSEKVKGSHRKFFELDPSESLCENLSGKCIIEYPIVFVVLKDHAYNFDIITPVFTEDEFDYHNKIEDNPAIREDISVSSEPQSKRKRVLLTEKIAQERKKEIEKEVKEHRKKQPKNLLFTTGYSSEESIHTDTEDEVIK